MAQARKFGWFGGVFTPSILTILGVIMYLRLPSIIGQGGLWVSVGIIAVAHVISVCTGLSVASIATDKRVEAGGTYYMISRSLGLPIGGTLGLALFVGLSFSVSLYVIGFSESFLGYWGLGVTKDSIRIAGSITLIAVTVVTFLSTELALRAQFYIMLAIGLSLLSIVTGAHDLGPTAAVAAAPVGQGVPFIVLFGIFFPAVTGFEAGVSMSGDLKDPKKAIPKGTILAILVGLLVYIALATFLARTVSPEALRSDTNILLNISRVPALVVAGIWGATISSAFGSILGAPRILQATAVDRITPRVFGRGFGPSNEPRNALLVTFLIAEAGILIGELDVIARIVSMFFITTYGFLNLSCAIERWASPDFRPEFKVPGWVGLLGAAACFMVMVQLDLLAMFGATVVLGGLYLILARRQLTLASGDTWEGVWSSVSRASLSRLVRRQVHQRNWRPNILLFAGSAEGRTHLRRLGKWLAYQRGLVSNVELAAKAGASGLTRPARLEAPEDPVGFFTHRVECEDVYEGMVDVARLHGFAGVEPNTVLIGWPRTTRTPNQYHTALDSMGRMDLNLLVLAYDLERGYGEFDTIDVWLEGGGRNASLALALVGFLATADRWRRAEIRLLKWYRGESAFAGAVHDALRALVEDRRLSATVQVVQATPGEDFATAVHRESGPTALTLLGIRETEGIESRSFVQETNQIVDALGTVLMLRASSSFEELPLGEVAGDAHLLPEVLTGESEVENPLPGGLDPSLGAEVERLGAALSEIMLPFEAELAVAESLNAGMLSDSSDLVRSALGSAEAGLEGTDRARGLRTIDRATARLLYRCREIFVEAGGVTLETQSRRLTAVTGLTARRIENLPATLPSRLDTAGRRQSVALRRSFETEALPKLVEHVSNTVRRFDGRAEARVDAAARLQAAAGDSLDRIGGGLDRPEGGELVTVESERTRLLDIEKNVLRELDQARASDNKAIRSVPQRILAEWARSLLKPTPSQRRVGVARREIASALERLRDVGPAWSSHQSTRLSQAELEARLRAARHRLNVVLGRTMMNLHQEVDPTVRSLQAARAYLEARPNAEDAGAIPDVRGRFDGARAVARFAEELRHTIQDLPDEWLVPVALDPSDARDPLETVETRTISPRAVVDHRLQTTLLTPLEPTVLALATAVQRGVETARDVSRLVRFAATEEEPDSRAETVGPVAAVFDSGGERLEEATVQILECLAAVSETAESSLKSVESHLIASAVAALGLADDSDVPASRSRWVQRPQKMAEHASRFVNRRMASIWYRRSRGVILSERLRAGERAERTSADRLLSLLEAVSPDPKVLGRLPFYYRQLFLGQVKATRDFWVARPRVQSQVRRAFQRFESGYEGALLLVGDPGSGKSSLLARVAKQHGTGSVVTIPPPPTVSCDWSEFERRLAGALGGAGDPEEALPLLPTGTIVVVDDLDLWWERRPGGTEVVERLLDLIDRFGSRVLFMVGATPVTARLLSHLTLFEDRFLASVRIDPFSAEELRDIVLLRHRSTGFGLRVEGRTAGALVDWPMARFFNRLFDRTRGNVGDALRAWIASIETIEGEEIAVRTRETVRFTALDELSGVQRASVAAVMLHRRLSPDSLGRIIGREAGSVEQDIVALRRCGLLRETGKILSVDRFIESDLRRDLEARGVL